MTQTSPRPAAQTATNNSKNTVNGSVGSGAPATVYPLDSNLISPQQVSNPLDLEGTPQTESQGVTRQRRGISLRTKVTALAISLGILPVLVFGAINNFLSTQETKNNAIQAQETLSLVLADKVSRFMFERYENILILSQLRMFTNSSLFNTTSSQEKEAQLESFSDAYGVYDSIALFELNGNMIVKTGEQIGKNSKGQITNNIKDRDHFQTVLKTDRPVISQPSISKTTGKASIFMAAPVKDTVTGKTIAVIRTRMPVEVLDELIKTEEDLLTPVNRTSSTLDYHLIGANGKFFIAEEEDEIGKNASLEISGFAQMQSDKKVTTTVDVDRNDSTRQLATYAPITQIEGVPELNWSIILGEDTTTVFAAQRRLLLSLLLGTGLLVLIVSAIAAQLANRTTQPILDATDAVEKLGQGKLDSRVAVKGDDELAVLGSNINLMASQLQDLLREKEAETQQTANLLTQIQASAKRLNKQNSVFVELSTNKALGSGELNVVFQEITEATSQTLEIERASVWLYNSDRSGIRCTDLYEKSAGHHSAGTELLAVAYPAYFKALIEERIIVANNAHTAPQTKEFSASYLSPLGITSMLNAQIRLGNQVVGVICCEHVGPSREWALEEQNFVASMADTVALSMEAYERKRVEEELKISEEQQRQEKQALQRRAMELLVEVDPISKGDLTIRASVTEDEIGTIADSYNATIGNLRKIVTQVQAAATQVVRTTNSNEVSVSEVSKEALQQAQEIAVALSRIQEMSNSIRAVATSAAQAEAAVEEATQTVEAGDAAMNRTVKGILAIRETVTETSQKVKRLGESSQNISKVVNLIGTFAAQTNLLALKASIEAARAGEEGRGFAVLADEVRGLARQSAQATAEIESLVVAIQTETKEVAAAMETGSEQVAEGTKLVDETRQSLNKITAVSAQIGALVEAIAAAAVVQSQASEEVTQTISDVAASANKNSNSATLVSASFKELLAVATELQASASQFKVS